MGDRAAALDARCLSALVRHRQELVESINVSSIVDHLVAEGVVNQQEYEALSLATFTNHHQAQCLIDILFYGSQRQFNSFVKLLRDHGSEELADRLDHHQLQAGERQWSDTFVHEVLVNGQVPFFDKITARLEKLELIRRGLRSVRSMRTFPLRVLLVHGMGGSGKTVLASEAVRCAPLMAECFPNGIIWKSAGHMRELKEAELKLSIHELIRDILAHPQLGWRPRYEGQKLSDIAPGQLGAEISHLVKHKQLLLVLDDVWQQDVLVALKNVPILVLATSRIKAIVEKLSAHTDVTAMKCTEQEARDIVTSHCDPVDEEALKKLLERCDGLPLALAIWASLLKNKARQEQKQIASAPSKAILTGEFQALPEGYKCLADALEASIGEVAREIKKKEKLGEVLMLSGLELSNLYLDIAALDDDDELFVSKLVPVWNQSTQLTHRLLGVLADRSLLTRTGKKRGEEEKEDVFTIHDVQLDFLRALVRSGEGGSLNGRYKRWIGGFLRKNKLSDLLVAWEQSHDVLYFEELWRIVRDVEADAEEKKTIKEYERRTACWQRCMKPTVTLLEQRAKLPLMQSELFTFLLHGVSHSGWSFVHQAALEGVFLTAELLPPLLEAFPNLNIHAATTAAASVNGYHFEAGTVPLHVAAASGQVEVVNALIENKAMIEAKTNSNRTPLHWASANGQVEVVNALIAHKAMIEAKNNYNSTPLHVASLYGQVEVVNALIENKAMIEAKTNSNSTPLHVASRYGHVEVVNALLAHNADVKAKDKHGWTPLQWASRNGVHGRVEVVRLLVQKGADRNAKVAGGSTPASLTSNKDIIAILNAK